MKEDVLVPDHSEPPVFAPESATREAAFSDMFDLEQTGNPDCADPDCGFYPHYGVAPHECFYKRGPEFTIGQSLLKPASEWPANFVVELEPGETAETVQYPGACGVYYCPTCLDGHPLQNPPKASDGDGTSSAKAGSGMTPENEASQ